MKNFKELFKNEFLRGRSAFDWAYLLFGILLQVVAFVASYKINGTFEAPQFVIAGIAGVIGTVLFAQGKISGGRGRSPAPRRAFPHA